MADIELIGVPFDGYGRAGSQALAPARLRAAGLAQGLGGHRVVDAGDLDLPGPSPERGAGSGLLNEVALLAMTGVLNRRVGQAVGEGRFPVVFGGDCSTLMGTVTGLRDTLGAAGLLFIDGHEDTMPLDVSEDGEAANAEIGLLLGLTGRLAPEALRRGLPALPREALAMLGQRDEAWRRQFNVGSLRDLGVWSRDLDEVAADPADVARQAVRHVRAETTGWWLHTDLDVLDPVEFGAQGLPGVEDEPGGLTWTQLTELLVAAVRAGGCLGWSIAIYDPEQDPDDAGARRIVRLARDVLGAVR